MTNAEVIRSMSDEELAEFLRRYADGDLDTTKTFCNMCAEFANCDGCERWWLGIDSEDHPQGLKYWDWLK